MSTIRRWDLTYDGDEHLMEFIERLEELAECYNFTRSRLLFALLEILKGRALQWYRVKRNEIESWEGFKEQAIRFFLPKRHLAHLEETIYHRKQGLREKAKDYIITLQALIRQHPELKKLNHTDRIYDGLRCEYKLYVRRTDFTTVDELMELTDEYELLRKEEIKQGKPQPSHYINDPRTNNVYCRDTHCWHCKQPGHFRRQCPNPGRLFCSWCGQEGIMSQDCLCSHNETSSDGRYYLNIKIFNTPVRALIDTGSTLTYIGDTVRQLIEAHDVRPRSHQRTVQLADGSCISSTNVYPIAVEANGQVTQLLSSALDSLAAPVILGMDFLRRRKATLVIDGIELQALSPRGTNRHHTIHSIKHREFLNTEQKNQTSSVSPSAFSKICNPSECNKHIKHNRRNPAVNIANKRKETTMNRPNKLPVGEKKQETGQHFKRKSASRIEHNPSRRSAPGQMKSSSQKVVSSTSVLTLSTSARQVGNKRTAKPLHSFKNLRRREQAEDLFRGIVVNAPSSKVCRWMVYPKGRPKIEVRVKNGVVRLRCQGKQKTFSLENANDEA